MQNNVVNHWVHDYETLINCFVACFEHYKTNEKKVFVIHRLRNDSVELVKFLMQNASNNEWHISFNGINFDSQISEFIIRNHEVFVDPNSDPEYLAHYLYGIAQTIIEKSKNKEIPLFFESELSIKQVDLYKLNHWDNKAKITSLKWAQFSMNYPNVQDMPIEHYEYIKTMDEINTIISYCQNDVSATKVIMEKCKSQINLRANLTKQYNINLYSASEPKISKELFLHFLSNKLKVDKKVLKAGRTPREIIKMGDLILSYVKFEKPEFKQVHDFYKNLEVNFSQKDIDNSENKNVQKQLSIYHKNVKTVYGLGGLHGARESGIYTSDHDYVIVTSDVVSYYPNLAIRNRWSPAHIPKETFLEQYEWFFEERKKIPKSDPRNYVYKIILNSTYGLSNESQSFLYDPELTMRITINGQLLLSMLYEKLSSIPESMPIMQNTDGLEMRIPRKYMSKYMEICKEWEDLTKLQLEHDTYEKIILGDVNNYIALFGKKEVNKEEYEKIKLKNPEYVFLEKNGKYYYSATKCKGRYEYKDVPLHKNNSASIVPEMIYNYFIKGIPLIDTINNQKTIFPFCIGSRVKGDDWNHVCNNSHLEKTINESKTLRFYISINDSFVIYKKNSTDGRIISLVADLKYSSKLKIINKIENDDLNIYDVDYSYYMSRSQKEIDNLERKYKKFQTSLFNDVNQ